MGVSDLDPLESKVQLEVLRERQRHADERIHELKQELAEVYTSLGRKDKELEQIWDEYAELKIQREALKKDLQYTQNMLLQSGQKTAKEKNSARKYAFFTSLFFLISSVLANIATGLLTSNFPNMALAWAILVLRST